MYFFIIAVFKFGCVPSGAISLKKSVHILIDFNKNILLSFGEIFSNDNHPSCIQPSN